MDPSNIGRDFSGKFPEKTWKFPDISRNSLEKKTKKLPKFREKTEGFFFSGLKQKDARIEASWIFICVLKINRNQKLVKLKKKIATNKPKVSTHEKKWTVLGRWL